VFASSIHFHTSLIFAGKAYQIIAHAMLHCNGRLIVLPANIRLGWKLMEVANTQAYYDMATITAVKSFMVQVPGFFVV
jgi:hypothetical protein